MTKNKAAKAQKEFIRGTLVFLGLLFMTFGFITWITIVMEGPELWAHDGPGLLCLRSIFWLLSAICFMCK